MDVHTYFGLSYANYLVRPRTLLQSMPAEWQDRFVGCLQEFDTAFEGVEQAPGYDVTPCRWTYANELTDAQMAATGVSEVYDPEMGETTYYDREGTTLGPVDRVAVPTSEPVPHYDRGRAYVAPNLDAARRR